MPGTLFVVATPIGNLEDITLRALRILREVSLIAAEDTRRTHHLLSRHAITTRMTSLHAHNEAEKSGLLISKLQEGQHIALVSDAGTPTVSDPGHRLIRAALDAGIRVEPLPGPSALLTALVGSGIAAEAFTFLGFPPTKPKDRKIWLNDLTKERHPVIFYESPHRLLRTLGEIREQLGDVQAVVARELTKVHEEFVRGPISVAIERFHEPVGEFTVVIEIGETTDKLQTEAPCLPPEPTRALAEFDQLTKQEHLSRREAIRALARRHNISARDVYKLIEQGKNSVP